MHASGGCLSGAGKGSLICAAVSGCCSVSDCVAFLFSSLLLFTFVAMTD